MISADAIIALLALEVSLVVAIFFKLGCLSKAMQELEKDIEQIKEKLERAAKQLITYSRDLRKSRNTVDPTSEEKDFKLRDLWDFNKKKISELIDISTQYPLIHHTLTILFAQVIF